tara:strand:+ start:576 stop:878 length:303 start_codon:yes stop_codon:yes gene_type:complete
MGKCLLRQYKSGVAWYCNFSNKRISPIMPFEVALLANIYGNRRHITSQIIDCCMESDARLITNWKDAKKQAKHMMKHNNRSEIIIIIENFYKSPIEYLKP